MVEVKAMLSSRPLTYVSSEDVTKEQLTPSHLIMGFRIMTLPDSTVLEEDPDFTLSSEYLTYRMSHLSGVLEKFWKPWKLEYLLELREFHRSRPDNGIKHTPRKGKVITIYDKGHPCGIRRLGQLEELLKGTDGGARGVTVRTMSKGIK